MELEHSHNPICTDSTQFPIRYGPGHFYKIRNVRGTYHARWGRPATNEINVVLSEKGLEPALPGIWVPRKDLWLESSHTGSRWDLQELEN